jgi:hypothetical protein
MGTFEKQVLGFATAFVSNACFAAKALGGAGKDGACAQDAEGKGGSKGSLGGGGGKRNKWVQSSVHTFWHLAFKPCAISVPLVLPGVLFVTFCGMQLIHHTHPSSYGSTLAVSYAVFIELLLLWVVLLLPISFLGSYLGFVREPTQWFAAGDASGDRKDKTGRSVSYGSYAGYIRLNRVGGDGGGAGGGVGGDRQQQGDAVGLDGGVAGVASLGPLRTIIGWVLWLLAGLLPFAVLLAEMHFVFLAMFLTDYYNEEHYLWALLPMWIAMCGCMSCALNFWHLHHGDHR